MATEAEPPLFVEAPPQTSPQTIPTYQSALDAHRASPVERPNGSWQRVMGHLCLWGGMLVMIAGLLLPTFLHDGSPALPTFGEVMPARPPTLNAWKAPVIWLGVGLSQSGLILWVLGSVLRALFFLPGRTVTVREVVW